MRNFDSESDDFRTYSRQRRPIARHTIPLPADRKTRCVGCNSHAVGFLCYDSDGICVRSEARRIDERSRARQAREGDQGHA